MNHDDRTESSKKKGPLDVITRSSMAHDLPLNPNTIIDAVAVGTPCRHRWWVKPLSGKLNQSS